MIGSSEQMGFKVAICLCVLSVFNSSCVSLKTNGELLAQLKEDPMIGVLTGRVGYWRHEVVARSRTCFQNSRLRVVSTCVV